MLRILSQVARVLVFTAAVPAVRLVDPSEVFGVKRGPWAGENERGPLLACFPDSPPTASARARLNAAPSCSAGIGFELGPKPAGQAGGCRGFLQFLQ
jgi:hypothetical protein